MCEQSARRFACYLYIAGTVQSNVRRRNYAKVAAAVYTFNINVGIRERGRRAVGIHTDIVPRVVFGESKRSVFNADRTALRVHAVLICARQRKDKFLRAGTRRREFPYRHANNGGIIFTLTCGNGAVLEKFAAGNLHSAAGNADCIAVVGVETTARNTQIFFITDLGISEQSIFSIGDNSFSFYLDINNYPELKTFLPFLSDPNFDVYGPEYNQGMSEADYLEMMSFLLGEEAPDAITNSQITIQLNVPGTISENVNAEVIDSDTVSFTFPLVKFLLLSEPIEFSVSWS